MGRVDRPVAGTNVALRTDVLDHHADFVTVGGKNDSQGTVLSCRCLGRTFEPNDVAEAVPVGLVAELSEDPRHQVLDLVFKTWDALGIAHPRQQFKVHASAPHPESPSPPEWRRHPAVK